MPIKRIKARKEINLFSKEDENYKNNTKDKINSI